MSRARFAIAACVAVIAAAVAVAPASAATSASANQTVKFSDQSAVQLTLSNTSYDFGVVDPLATVTSAPNATVATVFSNAAWHLAVKGTGNFSDGGGKTIPNNRMTITGSQPAVTLSNAYQTVATSATATPQAGTPTNLQYALTLQWGDAVSTSAFSDTLTYTAYTP
jgi:hypothetical protein